jgi:arabinogalactan oligomer / maltooligosaccharide transport system substrate-binding protein
MRMTKSRGRHASARRLGGLAPAGLLAGAVSLSLVLAACGNGDDPDTDPETPATEELLIWSDEGRIDVLLNLAERFGQEYNVNVTVQQLGFGDIRDQFKITAPAGEGPDIIIGAHDWLGELAENALLAEIDLGAKRGMFLDAAVDAFTYDGVLLGMPVLTENVALYYNPELVPEAPQTWDDVRQIAADLEASGDVRQGYVLQEADPYHFYPIMSAHGGYVFGLDDEGSYDPSDVGIASDGSLAAARWLEDMTGNGHLQADVDWEIMHTMFESGDAAMMISGPWALDRIRDSGAPYAIANIPSGAAVGAPFLGVHGFMISAFSEQRLLAEAFLLEFVATEDTVSAWYDELPHTPAFLPVRDAIDDADLAAFAAAGEVGQPMPAIPAMSAVWTAWSDAITLIMQGQSDAEEAFRNAATQIEEAIQGS